MFTKQLYKLHKRAINRKAYELTDRSSGQYRYERARHFIWLAIDLGVIEPEAVPGLTLADVNRFEAILPNRQTSDGTLDEGPVERDDDHAL